MGNHEGGKPEKQTVIHVLGNKDTDVILMPGAVIDESNNRAANFKVNESENCAGMLQQLLKEFFAQDDTVDLQSFALQGQRKTYSFWKESQHCSGSKQYFLQEFIGASEPLRNAKTANAQISAADEGKPKLQAGGSKKSTAPANIFAIYDATPDNETPTPEELMQHIEQSPQAWKVIRTTYNEGQSPSPFVRKLNESGRTEKTILILGAYDLRKAGFNIKQAVSWEQLIFESYQAVQARSELKQFEYVIICFEHEGFLILHNVPKGDREVSFCCYPDEIEYAFSKANSKKVFGTMIAFQAVIVYALQKLLSTSVDPTLEDIEEGAKHALKTMRKLIETGYDENGAFPYLNTVDTAKALAESRNRKARSGKAKRSAEYKRLESYAIRTSEINEDLNLFDVIVRTDNIKQDDIWKDIIQTGFECNYLSKAPHVQYGNLISFDKIEMQEYRKLYNLMERYLGDEEDEQPLSVCVFGPPGSGKSFAVKQIAKQFRNGKTEYIKCNLSQLSAQSELNQVFARIRDVSLRHKTPIVFWDEFDSNDLSWLKLFLAPLQDNLYYENSYEHHIGKSIFIFAGGVYGSSEEIKKSIKEQEDPTDDAKRKYYNAINKKLPDFLSRIRGFLDLFGIDQVIAQKPEISDKHFMLRRACLLRSVLQQRLGTSGEIAFNNPQILHAFLGINGNVHEPKLYRYGSRSLDTIIKTALTKNGSKVDIDMCLLLDSAITKSNVYQAFTDILNGK